MPAQSIGGPACRIVRRRMPGSRSRAAPTPTSGGCADSSRSTASSLARAIARGLEREARERVRRCRAAGGCQSTRSTRTPWRSSSSANRSTPTLATTTGRPRTQPLRRLPRQSARRAALLRVTTAPAAASARAAAPSRPCGSAAVPHSATITCAPGRARSTRRELGRRVGMRAVAEHDVQQQHPARSRPRRRRSSRSDWSIIGCARPCVYSSSPKSVETCRLADVARRPPPHSVPPLIEAAEPRPCRGRRRLSRSSEPRADAPPHQLGRARRRLARAVSPKPSTTGLPVASAASLIAAATSGSGGLEITTIACVSGSCAEQLEAAPHHQPADARVQVAPADADRVRDADPRRVEQAADLLRAGARRADDAHRPALDGVGEAERDAVDDRRAAVGAHEQQAALERAALERGLLTSRLTPSEKQKTCRPASSAAAASCATWSPGTDRNAMLSSSSPARRGGERARRGALRALPPSPPPCGERARRPPPAAADRRVVGRPDRDHEVVRAGSSISSKPWSAIRSRLSGVAIADRHLVAPSRSRPRARRASASPSRSRRRGGRSRARSCPHRVPAVPATPSRSRSSDVIDRLRPPLSTNAQRGVAPSGPCCRRRTRPRAAARGAALRRPRRATPAPACRSRSRRPRRRWRSGSMSAFTACAPAARR